jgi:hypothetical protein
MSLAGTQIVVTREHTLAGRRCSRLHCPVNLAIREIAPKAKIRVQLDVIMIDDEHFQTPKKASAYMEWFDRLPTHRRAKATLRGLTFVLRKAQ